MRGPAVPAPFSAMRVTRWPSRSATTMAPLGSHVSCDGPVSPSAQRTGVAGSSRSATRQMTPAPVALT